MTPDELKRLDARCRIARRDAVINGNDLPETMVWDSITKTHRERTCNIHMLDEGSFYALAEDVKPTPKTVEAREWDAYVSQNGFLYDKREISKSHQYLVDQGTLKPIRVREVIDTPKEPKERREYFGWVHDGGGDMVEVSDWEIVMGGLDPVKVGYRLATLVEKGGGE